MDGDGKADLVGIKEGKVYVAYFKGVRTAAAFELSKLVISSIPITIDFDQFPILIGKHSSFGAAIYFFGPNGVYTTYFVDRTTFSDIQLTISDFGLVSGYSNFDKSPRFLGDLNGDGIDDILACKENDNCYVSYSDGNGAFSAPQTYFSTLFTSGYGFNSFDTFPRFIAKIKTGSTHASFVGFGCNFWKLFF